LNECKIQKDTQGNRFEFYAQGAMNNALHEYVIDLGFEYNVTGLGFKCDYDPSILNNAVILHWSGSRKPWHINGKYKELYYSNYGILSKLIDKTRLFIHNILTKKTKLIHYSFNKILKTIMRISKNI
jgi:lipopolysaccharide biosynthesis glycosyltransferase